MLRLIMEETGSVEGFRRVWYDSIAFAFEALPEADIKRRLYEFLQCGDLTPADRAEIVRLLQLSGTAFTRKQRRQLDSILKAE